MKTYRVAIKNKYADEFMAICKRLRIPCRLQEKCKNISFIECRTASAKLCGVGYQEIAIFDALRSVRDWKEIK